ncbi:MAG: hypothetical protein O6943_08745 [Bacteroidetes bacterium]|nr:hypothetical protein [Bacteroidota bacterium]
MLAQEDGFYETATVIWFLGTAIIFFYLFFKDTTGNNFFRLKLKKNVFFLLLGMLFVFGAGEEINWGQRILNLQTPESLKEKNLQGQINIHNLSIFHGTNEHGERKTGLAKLLTAGRLFSIFWLLWCFIIPILNKVNSKIAKWLRNLNMPIVAIWIGVLFVLNHLIS